MQGLIRFSGFRRFSLVDLLFLPFIFFHLIGNTWNVDPYHEGALFPTAVGIAEGLSVFGEVNQQYGFLGPLLVSFLLDFFGYFLIIQRMFGFALTISISILFYLNLRGMASKQTSKYVVLIWVAVSPIWSWPPSDGALVGGYWPNHLGLALVLLGMLLLKIDNKRLPIYLSGILFFLSSQARMEFYFVWFFVFICLPLYSKWKAKYFAFGSLIAFLGTVSYLNSLNSLTDWVQQTIIVWTMEPPDVPVIGVTFLIFNALNFLGVTLLGLSLFALVYVFNIRFTQIAYSVFLICFLVLLLFRLAPLLNVNLSFGNFSISDYVKYVFRNALFSYVNISVLAFTFLLAHMILKNRFSLNRIRRALTEIWFIYVAAAIGSFSLFHNFNPDYTHMVWPFFALGSLALIASLRANLYGKPWKPQIINALKSYILGSVLASMIVFIAHSSQYRNAFETEMLYGLYGRDEAIVSELDKAFQVIDQSAESRKMLMVCQTGLFSVNTKGFLGIDKWTWNQQPAEMISNRFKQLKKNHTILACKTNEEDSESIKNLLKDGTILRIAQHSRFELYRVMKSLPQQS